MDATLAWTTNRQAAFFNRAVDTSCGSSSSSCGKNNNNNRKQQDRVVLKEEHSLYQYCESNLNFSTAFADDEDITYHQKKKIARDPMSHRIIEKRRRDRMNNCLADLSRLIPADYLKKGRGRIEKTEIIEMAIKHMRHLQSIISSRVNGETTNGEGQTAATLSSSAAPHTTPRDSTPARQPIVTEHYRLGYLECLSEAMHFLVEVQGFFAGDSLCVQMMSHLHKHCDKILKGDTLNFPRQINRETSSNSSTSTSNGNYANNNSPPLGMSNSTGSNSDDQRQDSGQFYQQFDQSYDSSNFRQSGEQNRSYNSNHRYPELSKREFMSSFVDSSYSRNNEESFEERSKNFYPRDYSTSSGIGSHTEGVLTVKEEDAESQVGQSQLRDMLISPKSAQATGETQRHSDSSPTGGCESTSRTADTNYQPDAINYKTHTTESNCMDTFAEPLPQSSPDCDMSHHLDSHNSMYKFKNNIKERFSQETGVNDKPSPDSQETEEQPRKKTRLNEEYPQRKYSGGEYYGDPLMKERLNLLHRHTDSENLRFNISRMNKEHKAKKRARFPSESEQQSKHVSSRLSFGHKSNERGRRWEEDGKLASYRHNKMMPLYSPQTLQQLKPLDLVSPSGFLAEPIKTKFSNLSLNSSEVCIPIFALHSKGAFYVPLTLDRNSLLPFLSVLGLTKSEEPEQKSVLHPVTISVNFQSQAQPREEEAKPQLPGKCPNYMVQHTPPPR